MAAPGWYPDPGGGGQFRYWDGTSWSARTSPTETAAGPSPGTDPGRPRRSRSGPAATIGLVSLLIVVVLVTLFVLRPWDRGLEITGDPPTPTVSAWDDGASPTPTPTFTRRTAPSPSDQPSGSDTSHGTVACPHGDPAARAAHPSDGRIHGGGLSFAAIPGWATGDQAAGMSFAYDVDTQEFHLGADWFALSAVGALRTSDGFSTPKQAADAITRCAASSYWYADLTRTDPVHSRAVRIDGHQGWSQRTRVFVDRADLPQIKGDQLEVTVVDVGEPDYLAVYLGQATIDDAYTTNAMQAAVASLQVDQ